MKKIASWLAAHTSFALALSGVSVFFGVVLSCPSSALAATLPLGFCFFLAASLVSRGWIFQAVLAAVLSLAYAFGMGVASPFIFAGEALLSVLTALSLAACLRACKRSGKKALWIPAAVLLLLGAALPLVLYGTPAEYLAARTGARRYLETRYPDQVFTRVDGYRDPALNVWHCDCSYTYEGNSLSSVILFGENTKDGFLEDRVAFAQEPRRSALIEALRDGEEGVLVEPDGFSQALADRDVIPGVYGEEDAALNEEMRFSVTFRREKTQKREFALAIREVTELLREKNLSYDALRFVAVSAGEPVYECTVTPDIAPEELLDLIIRV